MNEDLTVLNLVAEGLALTVTAVNQIEANGFQDRVVALPHFRASVPLSIGYLTANESDPSIAAVRDHVLRVWEQPARLAVQPEVIPFRSRGTARSKPRIRS